MVCCNSTIPGACCAAWINARCVSNALISGSLRASGGSALSRFSARVNSPFSALLTHLAFIQTAQQAPGIVELEQTIADQPGNLEARYQLSAVKLVADNYAGAMEQLLEITRRDRAFREDIGRRGLLAIFNILGNEHELVSRYRSLLIGVLH